MKTDVEELSPTRVKLTIEVPFEELKPNVDRAYREVARQVRIPGFRPGRVPPRVIDQRIGRGAVLEQAVQEAVPQLYGKALEENDVFALGQPAVEITKLDDGKELAFTAEVDVRPKFDLPDIDGMPVTVENADVDPDQVEEYIGSLRERFASLKGADRPVETGDFVSIDLSAEADGKPVEDAQASGISYEVGSGRMLDGLDEALVGMSAGESKTFTAELAGGKLAGTQADVTVTVDSVKVKELPELDDDFAQSASEFDTLGELRAGTRKQLENMRRAGQAGQARERALDALLARVDIPLPEDLVDREIASRRQSLADRLERSGNTMDEYLEATNQSAEELDAQFAEDARRSVKAGFILDKLATQEELGVDQDELAAYVTEQAYRMGVSPDRLAQELSERGQLASVAADVLRGKALTLIAERASVTDEAGRPVDVKAAVAAADAEADDEADDEADGRVDEAERRGGSRVTAPGSPGSGDGLEPCAYSEQPLGGGLPGPGSGLWSLTTTLAPTTEHIESEEGIVTTPAPDEWLAPMVARVAEAPALPFGDQLFQRLLRHRIVFLGQQVDDDLANRVCAELIMLAAEDNKRDIQHLHQLPRGLGHGRHGHLRRDAVRAERRRHVRDGHGGLHGPVPALRGRPRQALRDAARVDPDAPAARRDRRHRHRHQDPGRADPVPEAHPGRAHRHAHRPDRRADRDRLRSRPLVHRGRGQGLRLRGPGDSQRHRGPDGKPGLLNTGPGAEELTVNAGKGSAAGLWRPAESRYVLPSFVERTSYGIKEMNPYNKLFEERIIFLGVQIDDASANDVMAQLITLESIDPDRDILMYINSPGGSMTSMMAIYDTMQYIQPEIQTFCLGQAASAAAVLLAAGTKGKRMALPNSRILIHQPAVESGYGQSSDLEIQAREILRMRTAMERVIAQHTGKDEDQVRRDVERDKFFTAEEAKEYGLVDEVLTTLKRRTEVGSS